MKPACKFVIFALIAITCGYLIYYMWSIAFGEIDRNNLDDEISSRIDEENNFLIPRIKRTSLLDEESESSEDDLSLHKNFHLLNNENCGKLKVEAGHRIVNGKPARFLANPWIVALYYNHPQYGLKMMCAGTLISEKLIITASHCLDTGRVTLTKIRLGDYNLETDLDCDPNDETICAEPIQEISRENFEFVVHRRFNKKVRAYYDIGLIKLKVKANVNQNNIGTVCLPLMNEDVPRNLEVIGWGKTENGTNSDILLQTVVPFINNEKCYQKLAEANDAVGGYTPDLQNDQFCAGGKEGKDSCQGDSGGPLQALSYQKFKIIQYGIVSYGPKKCGSAPAVYTKISAYRKWILDNASSL